MSTSAEHQHPVAHCAPASHAEGLGLQKQVMLTQPAHRGFEVIEAIASDR